MTFIVIGVIGVLFFHWSNKLDDIDISNLSLNQKDEVIFSEDKVALVSGGTRGIGRGICEILKRAGATVIAGYASDENQAKKFTRETNIEAIKWDVSNFKECEKVVNHIIKDYGTISILFNNAGITRDTTINKITVEHWQEVINVNLNSVFNMTKVSWDEMLKNKFGRIINISSVNGQAGQYGQVNYCAAKAGIIGMTKAIAQEGARHNITANTVAPGYVDTEMVAAVPQNVLDKIISTIPVGRLGHPEEIARAVAFLAREDSQFVTGSTISINGGHHMY